MGRTWLLKDIAKPQIYSPEFYIPWGLPVLLREKLQWGKGQREAICKDTALRTSHRGYQTEGLPAPQAGVMNTCL